MLDTPQIPFEVYYQEYNKTVHVVGSCAPDTDGSKTLYFSAGEAGIYKLIFNEVNNAFNTPGLVRIQVCRIKER